MLRSFVYENGGAWVSWVEAGVSLVVEAECEPGRVRVAGFSFVDTVEVSTRTRLLLFPVGPSQEPTRE